MPAPMMATSKADCVAIAVLWIAFIAALSCCDDGTSRYLEVSIPCLKTLAAVPKFYFGPEIIFFGTEF
jgi:hypothetical protein